MRKSSKWAWLCVKNHGFLLREIEIGGDTGAQFQGSIFFQMILAKLLASSAIPCCSELGSTGSCCVMVGLAMASCCWSLMTEGGIGAAPRAS